MLLEKSSDFRNLAGNGSHAPERFHAWMKPKVRETRDKAAILRHGFAKNHYRDQRFGEVGISFGW